jgi:hypothetical protein
MLLCSIIDDADKIDARRSVFHEKGRVQSGTGISKIQGIVRPQSTA